MKYVIDFPPVTTLPVVGSSDVFPVNRIYCVGRNYAEHAREMGHDPDREPPFFFMKPADAIVLHGAAIPYPQVTKDLHHEIEMVVAIGKDSLEKTLAAIRNPPSGEASLRESDVPRRAAELLPLDPARMFGISDSSRSGGTLGVLRDMAEALVPEDVEASARDMLAGLQKLLPTETEMEGMFGVGVTTMRADDAGVSLQTAWEMPAP
jgi:hypothetical protein